MWIFLPIGIASAAATAYGGRSFMDQVFPLVLALIVAFGWTLQEARLERERRKK